VTKEKEIKGMWGRGFHGCVPFKKWAKLGVKPKDSNKWNINHGMGKD